MIEVITDRSAWRAVLANFRDVDCYHTYDYHHLSKTEDETPILIKYTDAHTIIALPLLIRNIKDSEFKDATSVYGYAGLLVLNLDDNFKKEKLHNELSLFFNEHNIISVFSRLHPFIEHQEKIHTGLGTIMSLGKVVYKNLSESLDIQRAKYNRRLKTYINKARKVCTVFEGNIEDHLDIFINLYDRNMKRVEAEDNYYFSTDYYHRLLSSTDFKTKLLLCKHNDTQEIIAGAIFMKTGNIVQYHLSGLNEDYFDVQPIKLIIDEMRIISTNKGYKYLNLGGGLGSTEDSLFKFKSGFSKDYETFKIWKYIVNIDAYKTLTQKHLNIKIENDELNKGYFPAYRAPIKSISYILSYAELILLPF